MVKNHSDSEIGNPLPPHGPLFPISSKLFLYASFLRQDNIYHDLCYTSCGALAGTGNSSMDPPSRSFTCDVRILPVSLWIYISFFKYAFKNMHHLLDAK